ncbi:MAG: winged helix-turn-helix domain-containing protein [Pseudomonadota bacterium]
MTQNERTALAFNALSHPRRALIFDKLETEGAKGLGFDALMAATGLQVSSLRHHLRPMIAAGLVTRRRKGLTVSFRLQGGDVGDAARGIAARIARLPPSKIAPPKTPLN